MSEERTGPRTLAIDIGGSGMKMMVLDEKGEPVTRRSRVRTPKIANPENVLAKLTKQIAEQGEFDRVSVGFPGVIVNGVASEAVNLDPSWDGFDVAGALEEATGKPVRVANDADVQGHGVIGNVEMAFGLFRFAMAQHVEGIAGVMLAQGIDHGMPRPCGGAQGVKQHQRVAASLLYIMHVSFGCWHRVGQIAADEHDSSYRGTRWPQPVLFTRGDAGIVSIACLSVNLAVAGLSG